MITENELKRLKDALTTNRAGRHHITLRDTNNRITDLIIITEFIKDYEGKTITKSKVNVTRTWSFTSEGPRVNSDNADNDLDELLSNDPDWVVLLEEKE